MNDTMREGKMYFTHENRFIKNGKEGEYDLTNFVCKIQKELVYHDGNKTTTMLVIDGMLDDQEIDDKTGERVWPDGRPLPEIIVTANEFAGLGWVAEKWGMAPIIYPNAGGERDLRTAIQVASRPTKEHIYTHTGWTKKGQDRMYLSASGAINEKGLDSNVRVELPHELRHYSLPKPMDSREAFYDSVRLVNVGPKDVTWPLLLATYRAAVGPVDFSTHLAGRTGTFKSEISSLFQSHYGAGMDARHLPASWMSTGNAVHALAYRAKDCTMCLDDFVPNGTAYQVRNLQKMADDVIRAQGNQSGRSRLSDISQMQTTFYPRGMIASTGEDVPEGHSVRARMMILELKPGDIQTAALTAAQNKRESYPQAMADWVRWLAGNSSHEAIKEYARKIRDANLGTGHSRTPPMIGELTASAQLLCEYAVDKGFLTGDQVQDLYTKAAEAILIAANKQVQYLESADPVKAVGEAIRYMLSTGLAHVNTKNGGVPVDPQRYGYSEEKTAGAMSKWTPKGPRLGWVDPDQGEFLLDPNAIVLLKKHSGGKLAITPQTLLKRMKEAGLLVRVDEERQRNTVRVTLEGHPKQVLVLDLAVTMDEGND